MSAEIQTEPPPTGTLSVPPELNSSAGVGGADGQGAGSWLGLGEKYTLKKLRQPKMK